MPGVHLGLYSTFLLERDADAEFAAAEAISGCARTPAEVLVTCDAPARPRDEIRAAVDASGADRRRMSVFLPRMTRFAELVKGFGLQLVYHHHMGTVVHRRRRSTASWPASDRR